jgi:hypothetical protein
MIKRTSTRAEGGITEEEKTAMNAISKKLLMRWQKNFVLMEMS